MSGLGLGLSMGRAGSLGLGAGTTYNSASVATFNAFTTPPDNARKTLINDVVVALIASGAWALIDALYMLAAADNQAARVNWKNPGTFTATLVNSPTFLADRGYTGDGATSGLSGPNPSSFGGQYVLDNAHMGAWVGTDVTEAGNDCGITSAIVRAHSGATTMSTRANNGVSTNGTISPATAVGHTAWARNNSAKYDHYKNGVSVGNVVQASTAITNAAMGICYAGSGFSTKRIAAVHIGASLSAAQITSVYNALLAYMTGVGAP